jgi:hypothetical protein
MSLLKIVIDRDLRNTKPNCRPVQLRKHFPVREVLVAGMAHIVSFYSSHGYNIKIDLLMECYLSLEVALHTYFDSYT